MNAATIPLYIALIALAGSVLSPMVQHSLNRKSGKIDAAEKFIRLAEGVADDYEALKLRHRALKILVRELVRQYDREIVLDPQLIEQLREVIT